MRLGHWSSSGARCSDQGPRVSMGCTLSSCRTAVAFFFQPNKPWASAGPVHSECCVGNYTERRVSHSIDHCRSLRARGEETIAQFWVRRRFPSRRTCRCGARCLAVRHGRSGARCVGPPRRLARCLLPGHDNCFDPSRSCMSPPF